MKSQTSYLLVLLLSMLLLHPAKASDTIENFLGMRFIKIPAGEFIMGTEDLTSAIMEIPEPEKNALADETPAHTVVISKAFYIAETEVTQAQWYKVMENKPGPDANWQRDEWRSLPVVSVNWFMAARFVEEINKMDDKHRYRLPTEAEWEYVAKDGINELRPVSIDELEDYAWFINNSKDITQAVATRKPNRFGVYDMTGNVWEWVADWYAADSYASSAKNDPVGPAEGLSKVRRGGSYHCPQHLLRPGYRAVGKPGTVYEVNGFRIIAEPRQS